MEQVAAAWAIEFHPAPMFFSMQTDDDAGDFAVERMAPMLMSMESVQRRLPGDISKRSAKTWSLTDMWLKIQGANKNSLISKSVRWVFNDECAFWKEGAKNPGLIQFSRERATQYWNRRIFNVSTAGDKDCDFDQAFEEGDKREWHLQCPECGQLNLPKWERIVWPKDATALIDIPDGKGGSRQETIRRSNGEWNYQAVKAAARFECEHCGCKHQHTEDVHVRMNAGARYIATNPNPTPGRISFRWNALCLSPSVCSWGDLAVEFLKAKKESDKGNDTPLREFFTKRMAESWDGTHAFTFNILPTCKLDLSWADEAYRFMSVDVQQTSFWVVIRAWAKTGESRLLWAGQLFTWADLDAKQAEFKVNSPCVFVDAGFDQQNVVRECAKRNRLIDVNGRKDWSGWKALDGENKETKNFTYRAKNSKPVLLPYSWPPRYMDGQSGLANSNRNGGGPYCQWFLWSNRTIGDIHARLRDGTGAIWLGYDGVCREWHEHQFSQRRIKTYNDLGQEKVVWERVGRRQDHLLDAERMNIVGASMAGIIGEGIKPVEKLTEQ